MYIEYDEPTASHCFDRTLERKFYANHEQDELLVFPQTMFILQMAVESMG